MSHAVSSSHLPVPVSDVTDTNPGVPYLDIILTDSAKALQAYCGDAWAKLVNFNEPIVRKTYPRDPALGDFAPKDLPALYAWPERVTGRRRLADDVSLKTVQIRMMWVCHPTKTILSQFYSSFWIRLDDAINAIANPEWTSVDTTTTTWGESIKDKCGFWALELGNAEFHETAVGKTGQKEQTYPGITWVWNAEVDFNYDLLTGPAAGAGSCTRIVYKGGRDADIDMYESHLEP